MSQVTTENHGEPTEPPSAKKIVPDIPAGSDTTPEHRYGANIQLIRRRLLDEKRTADWLRRRKGG